MPPRSSAVPISRVNCFTKQDSFGVLTRLCKRKGPKRADERPVASSSKRDLPPGPAWLGSPSSTRFFPVFFFWFRIEPLSLAETSTNPVLTHPSCWLRHKQSVHDLPRRKRKQHWITIFSQKSRKVDRAERALGGKTKVGESERLLRDKTIFFCVCTLEKKKGPKEGKQKEKQSGGCSPLPLWPSLLLFSLSPTKHS